MCQGCKHSLLQFDFSFETSTSVWKPIEITLEVRLTSKINKVFVLFN